MTEALRNKVTVIKTFRDLIVWQKSISFVTEIYKMTNAFPKEEQFSLTNQLRRAAISIPSNIAEGFGRHTRKEYIRFLQIAIGSTFELQTQIEIAKNLSFIPQENFSRVFELSREIERMLSSLITKLKV